MHRISPPEAWRVLRAERWTAEGSHLPHSELVGSGVVTSSSGIACYRGDAYPEKFRGNLFVADVAANLFYRLIPEPDGLTFKANRSPEDGDREFCASRDIWHRPVNFTNAPDGTLTVCDMYREAIEHPWSLPDDIHAALDLERGRDKGRLFRLAPPQFTRRKTPPLSRAGTEELVKLLGHPNAWHRDTAQRLLFERLAGPANREARSVAAVPLLRQAFTRPSDPLSRIEVLWMAQGLGELSDGDLAIALQDKEEHTQLAAIAIIESRLGSSSDASRPVLSESIRHALTEVISHGSLSVRLHGMLVLDDSVQAKTQDLDSPWLRMGLLATNPEKVWLTCEYVLLTHDGENAYSFLREGGSILAKAEKTLMPFLFDVTADAATHRQAASMAFLEGLCQGFTAQSEPWHAWPMKESTKNWLQKILTDQKAIAANTAIPVEERIRALTFLSLEDFAKLPPLVSGLLQPSEPDAIRLAMIQMLRQKPVKEVPAFLLSAWPTLTPGPREAAAQALASRAPWTEAFLSAVENQQIKPSEISPTIRASLQRLTNTALRDRAAKLFTAIGTRAEVLAKYQSALALQGDATAGHVIYTSACAVCHRKGPEGRDIGPNLGTVLSWTNDQLLTNILDPNREVSPNFLLYSVELKDGRTLAGLITSETPTSIALKGADGIEQNVIRSEVKSLKSTGLSLMPEGLEAALTPQQLADLMAFLRQ